MSEHLVIGIGNPDRGDDSAGVLVARKIRGARVMEWADCSMLIDLWDTADDVIIVDAMRSGLPPGTVREFDAGSERLPSGAFTSSHAMGVADAVELARALDRLPNRLTVYGIEAEDMSLGLAPCEAVVAAADRVADEINERLRSH